MSDFQNSSRQSRRRLRREHFRQATSATIRACRESRTQEEAIARAEAICRDEYGFIETLLIALLVKVIIYLVPIIWNWIKSGKSDAEIEAMLDADSQLIGMFADEDAEYGDDEVGDPHD